MYMMRFLYMGGELFREFVFLIVFYFWLCPFSMLFAALGSWNLLFSMSVTVSRVVNEKQSPVPEPAIGHG